MIRLKPISVGLFVSGLIISSRHSVIGSSLLAAGVVLLIWINYKSGEWRSEVEVEPAEPIFTVTVLKTGSGRKRVWGWYPDFETAEKAVLTNDTDIFECDYYDLAVIEKVPPGILSETGEPHWYRAVYSSEYETADPKVERIDCPKEYINICNLSIG